MREYKEIRVTKKIPAIIKCNKCGRAEKITGNDFKEDEFHTFSLSFSYGSSYDEQTWKFDLCETCLVDFVKTFKHLPDIS